MVIEMQEIIKIIEQNNIKNNPFELIPQTSASQENISPRFIDGIINDDNNSYHEKSDEYSNSFYDLQSKYNLPSPASALYSLMPSFSSINFFPLFELVVLIFVL